MPRPFAKLKASLAGTFAGIRPLFFQPSMQPGKLPRGPALFVEPLRLDELLDEPDLVVRIEDREVRRKPHKLGMAAQNAHADGVERAEPGHALHRAAHKLAHALFHLARGLVGEGHGENFVRARAVRPEDVRDARGQHPRFACACARQNEHRAIQPLDSLALLGVQTFEVRGFRRKGL